MTKCDGSLIDRIRAEIKPRVIYPQGFEQGLERAISIIRQHEAEQPITDEAGRPMTYWGGKAKKRPSEISDNTYNAAVKELEYCSPGELGTKLAAVFRALRTTEPEKCPDCGADMMEVCSGLEDVCKREPVMSDSIMGGAAPQLADASADGSEVSRSAIGTMDSPPATALSQSNVDQPGVEK